MTNKIKDTLKIALGAVFAVFAIWQITVPVEEAVVSQLIDIIFALLGGIIGGPGLVRLTLKKKLIDE